MYCFRVYAVLVEVMKGHLEIETSRGDWRTRRCLSFGVEVMKGHLGIETFEGSFRGSELALVKNYERPLRN
jgi:hypothetical protein